MRVCETLLNVTSPENTIVVKPMELTNQQAKVRQAQR